MANWKLIFRKPRDRDASLEAIENAIAAALGAPVTMSVSEIQGNPYDSFYGDATIRGRDLEATVQRSAATLTSEPINGDIFIYVKDAKLRLALADALAKLGYTDDTP